MNLVSDRLGPGFEPGSFYVLDGGMASCLANHLPERSVDQDPLWGAGATHTQPDAVRAVHEEFLNAGAQIITTNTYQCSLAMFKSHLSLDHPHVDAPKLFKQAVDLARKAIENVKGQAFGSALVAGSVGPYGACLGDGSEYTGAYLDHVSSEELEAFHFDRIQGLAQAGVDIMAVESQPSVVEALAILNVFEKFPGVKCWISFQCRNETETARGEPFEKVVQALLSHPASRFKLKAIGVNCTRPEFISPLLTVANKVNLGGSKVPYIVYPNSGENWDGVNKCWSGDQMEDYILTHIEEWMRLGACVIGGCCRIQPKTIGKIKAQVVENIFHVMGQSTRLEAREPTWASIEASFKVLETSKTGKEKKRIAKAKTADPIFPFPLIPGVNDPTSLDRVHQDILQRFKQSS
ncbi:uncharacterized protein LOC131882401 [Tigriopus californicus]|uniref:uncharacterized protein LOC131882401 n=1 Tax=Tigriopus californicus TaxID=6832 RepID=UPI0027D9F4EC|nr:uncharacterized protein LOC131882401 [Tigriopus californicus]